MTLPIVATPSVHLPASVSNALFTVSSTPQIANPFSVVAGAGTAGVTFSNLHWLAYATTSGSPSTILAAADKGGGIYVFNAATGALLHTFTVTYGTNIGGIAVDPGGLIYVIEVADANNTNTGSVHQYSQSGTLNWTYTTAGVCDAGWGWQSSGAWYVVATQRSGGDLLITTSGTLFGTKAMAPGVAGQAPPGGAQAPGAALTVSTYESNPQYVYQYDGSGTATLHFGSGARFADATVGRCFSLLSGAVTMADGVCYVLDSDGGYFYRFASTGFQTGSTTLALAGSGHSMTQVCPIASDGTTLWFGCSDSGGLLMAVSRANLDTLLTYPRTANYPDQSMGVGAGLISSATDNYYASGSTPAISLYLDAWWGQEASLTARYAVRTAAQVQAQAAQVWTTISSPTTGGSTALSVLAGTGYYEVEAQLLLAGVPKSASVLYYAVGPTGATLNLSTLAAAGTPQREVQLAGELLGPAGMVRAQLDWSVLLPSGPAGGANTLVTTAYDTLIANAATEAAARGVTFEVQIFQGNGDAGETALFAYAGWVSYITALVNHFKANVHNWDLWNEVNNTFSGAGGMADFTTNYLIPAANAIHAADATALVVGPSFLKLDLTNTATVGTNGGFGVVDVVSVHPYGEFNDTFDEQGQPAQLDAWITALGTYSAAGKPRWFTEWGSQIDSLVPNLTQEAAAYASVLLWMRVKNISHLYPFVYEGTGGLSANQGLFTSLNPGGNPPSAMTMAAAVCLGAKAAYGSRTYHDQPATNAPLTTAVRFVDSDQLIAVWSAGVTVPMQVTSSAACTLTVWDAFGATSTHAVAAGGTYAFSSSALPTSLEAPTSTTLTLAGQEAFGTNLATSATATVSSTGTSNGGASALNDGIVDAQGADGFPLAHAWYQAVSDTSPAATLTLASPATVDRVLVLSHSNGNTIPSVRNYTVSTQVGGVWTVRTTVADQYMQRGALLTFAPVANCQAVRVDVQAINYGGFAGGMQPSFWKVSGNPAGNVDFSSPTERFYGPAPILEVQVFAPGAGAPTFVTYPASATYPTTATYPSSASYPVSATYPS